LVSGPDHSYLWLMARSPALDAATRDRLVARAAAAGFDTSKLIFVDQSPLP
jgi:apolipoprotein D and lipocalin family protein